MPASTRSHRLAPGLDRRPVMGRPGHTGHTSAAARSQTVKTKSRVGAEGLENSSQFLLRSASVERLRRRSRLSAGGHLSRRVAAGVVSHSAAIRCARPVSRRSRDSRASESRSWINPRTCGSCDRSAVAPVVPCCRGTGARTPPPDRPTPTYGHAGHASARLPNKAAW